MIHYGTLLQNKADIITKCDSYFITKCDRGLLQNTSGFLLQNATVLLQNSTVITKWNLFVFIKDVTLNKSFDFWFAAFSLDLL